MAKSPTIPTIPTIRTATIPAATTTIAKPPEMQLMQLPLALDLFAQFRKQSLPERKEHTQSPIYFRIDFDEQRAFVTAVDVKNNAIEVDYHNYTGKVRDILKSIDKIKEKSAFRIDWEKPSDRVYLAEHEYLIHLLSQSDRVIGPDALHLTFVVIRNFKRDEFACHPF